MKVKFLFLSLCFLTVGTIFSQNKSNSKSIISTDATIKKYHILDELKDIQKKELLDLYIERVKVLTKVLPYIPLTTKPGITITDLGIPDDSDNKKILESQAEETTKYLESTFEFQKKLLPYSDKEDLIASILFYENILKSLHEFEDLK
ncbi:MAG TPA: hypothetical protein VL859_08215 [Flavobacterium sp.]|nr:hypothetical protein [Flavobacterium sp.]